MAVAPLQIPGYQLGRDADFSSLAQLPQLYQQGQQNAARREALSLANLGQGGEGFGKAINSLAALGDLDGATKLAGIQKALAPETSADMQAYNLYKRQGGQKDFLGFKKEIAEAGASRTNVNTTVNGGEKEFDKALAKDMAEQYVNYQKTGRTAAGATNTLNFMEGLTRDPNFYSGSGGELVTRGKQALSGMGITAPDSAKANELFGSLANKLTVDAAGGSLGAQISNNDVAFLQKINPSLATTPEGNREIIGYQRKIYGRQQDVARMAREYAKKNNGRLDSGFDAVVADYAEKNPLFSQSSAGGGQTSRAAPVRVSSPDEARKLPSGTPIILPDGTQGRVP